MQDQDYILKLSHISKIFPGVRALDDMHLELKRGEIHGVVGENGAGKSTMIKIISGVHQPTEGTIELDGQPVTFKNPHDAKMQGIACVYQELNVLDNLTVTDNLFAGNMVKKKNSIFLDYKYMNQRAKEVLDELHQSFEPSAMTSELGVGQKQMIEIGKSIMLNVKVLVLDEPTSSLGQSEINQLFAALRRLKAKGISIIIVTHKLEEIYAMCDRVTVMRDARHISTTDIGDITRDEMISQMVGRTLTNLYPKQEVEIGEVAFEAKDLSSTGVFRNISFQARRGEILGFSGLVGAGRTELFRAIFGADPLTGGEVFVNGQKVVNRTPKDAVKNRIALLTEDRKLEGLVLTQSIRDNIALVDMDDLKKGLFVDDSQVDAQAKDSVKKLNIKTSSIYKDAGELSGGNQQKVVIAKWLGCDIDVYVFDEPTRGIDIGAKIEVYNIMTSLVEAGKCIIMISSELPEILGLCDRVLVMGDGEIKAEVHRGDEAFTQEGLMRPLGIGGAVAI